MGNTRLVTLKEKDIFVMFCFGTNFTLGFAEADDSDMFVLVWSLPRCSIPAVGETCLVFCLNVVLVFSPQNGGLII